MRKLLTAVLFTAALASAQQYSYSYTAPAGAITCSRVQPYQQHYSNLVENSTPPYPDALPPDGFHMPAFPNHPYPIATACAPNMGGFVSSSGTTATLQLGGSSGWLRLASGNTTQAVQLANAVWTSPTTYPTEGQSVEFDLNADIISVCNAICEAASGNLQMIGHFHFNWKAIPTFRWVYVLKVWTDDDAQINGLSTVAILD